MGKLTRCKTCGKEIASSCKKCIHCGAKNKQGSFGCGTLLIVFIVIAALSAAIQDKTPTPAAQGQQQQKESAISKLNSFFAELKSDPDIEKYTVTESMITVVYKGDVPEMAMFRMRDYAESGSRITKSAFTAQCSVSAEPGKILYSEQRENRKTTAITFSENLHAKDKKAEKMRIAEAKRQKKAALQKEIDNREYAAFHRRFVSDWDGSCRPAVKAVKATMHDPDSFKHVKSNVFSVTGEKGMYLVEMTFQGKNAFGATVTNKISAKLTKDGKVLKINPIN